MKQREILFRGIRVEPDYVTGEKVFAYGNLLNDNSIGLTGKGLDSYAYYEVILETVGQFIGLCDKNKVKIFEGCEIEIKHPHKNRTHKGIVEWMGYKWGVKGFCFNHFDDPQDIFSEGTEYIEVSETSTLNKKP